MNSVFNYFASSELNNIATRAYSKQLSDLNTQRINGFKINCLVDVKKPLTNWLKAAYIPCLK